MGTIILLTPLLGLLSSVAIAQFTKQEIKDGRNHLLHLQYGLIALIVGIVLYRATQGTMTTLSHLVIPFFLLFLTTGSLYHQQHRTLAYLSITYIAIAVLSAFLF